jgi:hypothetical protein
MSSLRIEPNGAFFRMPVSRVLLLLAFAARASGPALADTTYALVGPLQQVNALSAEELGRLSAAGLKGSGLRMGRLRQCAAASRAEAAVGAAGSYLKSVDRFALGSKIIDPVTLQIPTKLLHEKTVGQIRRQAFAKYKTFDDYWRASGTGTRGKFFESQSVLQANSALKKQGSSLRYAITAVEGSPGSVADVVLINADGKIIARYQFKSTRNIDDIVKFSLDARYADMPIVTHPETVAELRKKLAAEMQRAARRGKPLSAKWQAVKEKLANGLITDSMVEGKPVSSHAKTTENARRFRLFHWQKGPSSEKVAKGGTRAATKTFMIPKAVSKLGVSAARVVKGSLVVLETVAAPLDLGFAAYGYYDTFSRYARGGLSEDLLVTKLAIHTSEAALGGAAVYSVGVGLGLIAVPEPFVSKVVGVVVIVGSVVVIAADFAVSAVIADRDQARERTLESLTNSERYLALRFELTEQLGAASSGL